MTLLYKPVQTNMSNKDGLKLWYPHLVKHTRTVTTHDLAVEIAKISSLTEGEVHNVVRNLLGCMSNHLKDCKSVQLDGLGTFTLKIQAAGNGVLTPEEVSPKQINALKVQFTPAYKRYGGGIGKVCPMVAGAEFEKLKEEWLQK